MQPWKVAEVPLALLRDDKANPGKAPWRPAEADRAGKLRRDHVDAYRLLVELGNSASLIAYKH
eukprot:7595135-Lingulodinium_polyedra.AAC.1